MINKKFKKVVATTMVSIMTLSLTFTNISRMKAASTPKTADLTAYSIEGYAQADHVTGGGILDEEDSNYYQVSTAEELLALLNKKNPNTGSTYNDSMVIEIMNDIDLGYKLLSDTAKSYNVKEAVTPKTHPILKETGVSTVYIQERSNITLFSKNGSKIKHACFVIKGKSNNIIIRNLEFDEIWEWDDSGNYDSNDWDYFTIEGASYDIWIDHCTFHKAYDGVVDIKKASHDITVSWCSFLPGDLTEGSFFMEMMNYIENNQSSFPNYKAARAAGMTFEDMCIYGSAQKKTHLIGHSDSDSTMSQLSATFANNYYKNSMDRLPRIRGGNAHVYNSIMDSSDIWNLKNSLAKRNISTSKVKLVSNGAISTCGASVLLENCYINGINVPLRNNNTNPDKSTYTGKIAALNSYYAIENINRSWSEYTSVDKINYTGNYSFYGNSTDKGSLLGAWPCTPLDFDTDNFKDSLGYQYTLYKATDLPTILPSRVGAGALDFTAEQWMKTTYSTNEIVYDSVIPSPGTEINTTPAPTVTPEVTESPLPTATPIATQTPSATSTPSATEAPTATPVVTETPVSTPTPDTSKTLMELNISNDMSTGTLTSDTTVNGFTFITGGSKWTVDKGTQTFDDTTYTLRAKSGGKGTTTKRAISFDAPANSSLTVYAMSGGSDSRSIALSHDGSVIETKSVLPNNISSLDFSLTSGGNYIIYTPDDSISFYYIKVTQNAD